jgi:hypothetical protein
LLQAAGRLVVEGEAGMILVKQLAFENANAACQMAIRPYRKKGILADYNRLFADIGPSYLQGVAMATAIMTPLQLWKTIHQSSKRSQGNCFNCGKPGRLAKQCPQKSGGTSKPIPSEAGGQMLLPPALCLKYHWERKALGNRRYWANQ